MRILFACIVVAVLGVTSLAWADSIGCGDDTSTSAPNQDLSATPDQATPRDLSAPDLLRRGDARRERRTRRRTAGAGLVVLSALALSGAVAARQRVRARSGSSSRCCSSLRPARARADAEPAPGQCIEYTPACGGCAQQICAPPAPDLSASPHDLSAPAPDLWGPPDACREIRRRHNRARGRGLVLLSGLSALALIALRRRYRTRRPTPAESALAANATRSDS